MKKRMQSAAKWIRRQGPKLGLLAFVLLLLAWGLTAFFLDDIARHYLNKFTANTNVRLQYKNSRVGTSTIEVFDAVLTAPDGEELLRAKHIQANYRLSGSGWSHLGDIQAKGVTANLRFDPQGHFNWAKLSPKSPSGKIPTFWQEYIGGVHLDEVTLHYKDERAKGFEQDVVNVTLDGKIQPQKPVLVWANGIPVTSKQTGNPQLKLEGQFDPLHPMIEAKADFEGLQAAHLSTHPLIPHLFDIRSGQAKGRVWIDGHDPHWGPIWHKLNYRLTLNLQEVRAGFAAAVLDRFVQRLNLPASVNKTLRGQALADTLQTDSLKGTLQYGSGVFQLKGFEGRLLGGRLKVQGDISAGKANHSDQLLITGQNLQLQPLAKLIKIPANGALSGNIKVESPLDNSRIWGQLESKKVVVTQQVFRDTLAVFDWDQHALNIENLTTTTAGGKIQLSGLVLPTQDPKVALSIQTSNATLGPFLKAHDKLGSVRGSGRFSVLGSVHNPIVAGRAQVAGLSAFGLPIDKAESSVVADRSGAVLTNAKTDGEFSGAQVPWATIDFASGQGAARVDAQNLQVGGAQVSGSVTVSGDIHQPHSWAAAGHLSDGSATFSGQNLAGIHGDFLYKDGQAHTPGLWATWNGGLVQMLGSVNVATRTLDAVVAASNVDLSSLHPGLSRGEVLARIQGNTASKAGRAWVKTPQFTAAVSGFGTSLADFRGVSWFSGVRPEQWGLSLGNSSQLDLSGTALLEQLGNQRKVYYDVASSDSSIFRLVGEAFWRNNQVIPSAFARFALPTQSAGQQPVSASASSASRALSAVSLQYSPKIMEGSAYTYHGPQQGREIRDVKPIGRSLSLAKLPPNVAGISIEADRKDPNLLRLQGDNIDLGALLNWLDQSLPAQSYSSMPVSVEGSYRLNKAKPQQNQAEIKLYSPWVRLVGLAKSSSHPVPVFSLLGTLTSKDLKRWDSSLGIAPKPYQNPQTSPNSMVASGTWSRAKGLDFQLDSRNFPLASLYAFVDDSYGRYLPTGHLSAKNLRIWGDPKSPAISGSLAVTGGRLQVDQNLNLPLDEAQVQFKTEKGTVSLDHLLVRSQEVTVSGSAQRNGSDQTNGLFTINKVPIRWLGLGLRDVTGDLSGQVALKGKGFKIHEIILAAASSKIGVKGSPLQLGSVQFGRSPKIGEGLRLSFQGSSIAADIPIGSTEASLLRPGEGNQASAGKVGLSGSIQIGALPTGSAKLLDWLNSRNGPHFGDKKAPFRLYWNDLELVAGQRWLMAAGILNPKTALSPVEGNSTGDVQLRGAFGDWPGRDSLAADFHIDQLNLFKAPSTTEEKPTTSNPAANGTTSNPTVISGDNSSQRRLTLSEPVSLSYTSKGAEKWLDTKPFRFSLLAQGVNSSKTSQKDGSFSGELHLPIIYDARKGSSKPSLFHLEVEEMPVDILTALFPFLGTGSGTIHRLSIDGLGDALRPNLHAQLQLGPSQIGRLNLSKVDGDIFGLPLSRNRYRLFFASGSAPNVSLENQASVPQFDIYLGKSPSLKAPNGSESSPGIDDEISAQHRLSMKGGVELQWLVSPNAKMSQPYWTRFLLSRQSLLDLHAELLDQDARLMSAFFPGTTASGKMSGVVDLTGTLDTPQIAGNLGWENGTLKSPFLGAPMTDIFFKSKFEKIGSEQAEHTPTALTDQMSQNGAVFSRYSLERLSGNWGGKPFEGKGKAELVGLEPSFLNLSLAGKELPLKGGDYFNGTGDVDLQLLGQVTESEQGSYRLDPTLTGNVTINKGDLQFPLSVSQPTPAWAKFWKANPVAYRVGLNIGDDVWASILNSSVRGQGQLSVVPAPETGVPVLEGDLFLTRGIIRIPVYEVNFRIRQGFAHFYKDLMPVLENVSADTTLGTYQITARFDGKYPNIRAELVSNPPLANSDLQRLVGVDSVSGINNSSTSLTALDSNSQNNLLGNQGVTVLSNLLTGQLTQGLGRLLFLSEVTFDVLPPNEYVVRLAKSLDDRDKFLVTFTQVVRTARYNQNEQQYGVEWRFQPNLLTRISLDNFGQARFWFQGLLRF